jgi:hypothetical protein
MFQLSLAQDSSAAADQQAGLLAGLRPAIRIC